MSLLNNKLEGFQPFEFIAADSIDGDTTVVELEAWAWSGGGGASRIAGGGVKDTLGNPPIALTTLNERMRKHAKLEEKLKKRLAEEKTGRAKYTTAQTNAKDKLMIASEAVTDCRPIVHVMITRENRPPVIERITFDPPRRYFAYDSLVTVNALATDPDGDSVTITYLPSQSFRVVDLGPIVVTVIAKDSKDAVTEKRDTIYSVLIFITPSRDPVKDGENISYEVKIVPTTISANSVRWAWETENTPAGNSPRVNFTSNNLQQKVIIDTAKWYASPDDPCGASNECTYKLTAKTILGQDEFDPTCDFTVWLPSEAAITKSEVTVKGTPLYEEMTDNGGKTIGYKVAGKGSITRLVNVTPTQYFIPSSSQFMPKTEAHEEVHRNEYTTGVAKDYWSDVKLYDIVKDLMASTYSALDAMYNKIYSGYLDDEKKNTRKQEIKNRCERAAYDVSDPIVPQYFYQRCGRFSN